MPPVNMGNGEGTQLRSEAVENGNGARGEIDALDHPLVGAPHGFREYPNQKAWACRFCASTIPPGTGYWGTRRRFSGSRDYAKVCSECFLKFLLFIEENPRISKVLRGGAEKRLT